MPISVQCPECYKQYRIKDDFAGMRMRCTQCGHSFVVPAAEPEPFAPTPPEVESPARTVRETAPVFDAERTAIEQPPISQAPVVPPLMAPKTPKAFATASPAQPQAPAATAHSETSPAQSGSINFGTVLDFAQDWPMVLFVLQWVGLCTIPTCIAASLVRFIPFPFGMILGALLMILALATAALSVICGISHMTGVKLATGTAPPTSSAWSVFLRRFFSLTIGTLGVWFGTCLALIFGAGVIAFLSYSPYVGQLLGGVLLIPTFVGVIFGFGLLFNLYLLPVAIGVEDCSAGEAFERLKAIVAVQRLTLYSRYFSAAFALIPAILTTLLMTAIPLAISLALCGIRLWIDGPGVQSVLIILSTAAILLSAIAYGVVLVTVAMALVYCQSTSAATVYRQ